MTPDNNSKFNSAFKIHKSQKGNDAGIRLWDWKVKLVVGFSTILLLIFLAVLFILELTNSTKILKSVKTKRFVKMDGCCDESENTETVQNDIHIIPEGRLEDFASRANQHPNHRYIEIEPDNNIYKNVMKDLYDKGGWSRKPFYVKKKPKYKKTGSGFFSPKSLGDSLRFKGVFGYVSPENNLTHNPSTENFYYSQEINNLMQNYSVNQGEENGVVKKAFKSHGAPFQVPVKDVPKRERLNVHRPKPSKAKQSWLKEQFRKKPLTILLDIYPMAEADEYFKKEGPKLSHIKASRNEFWKPRDIHSKEKFLFPGESRNGIIMKLNLYARDRRFSRRQNSVKEAEDAVYLNDRNRAEEKSFGWFLTKEEKKQEPKKCSLMALKPQGKHVTAKWKNKNGEWIHAKRLLVKYLKK